MQSASSSPEPPAVLVPLEVAEYLRYTSRHVTRLIMDGELRGWRISTTGPWRISRDEVVRFRLGR